MRKEIDVQVCPSLLIENSRFSDIKHLLHLFIQKSKNVFTVDMALCERALPVGAPQDILWRV